MLFNSYEFIFLFLPFTFFIYFYLLQKRLTVGARGFLVFASLFFYSWWNIVYLPLILSSMLFNYVIGNSLNENFKKAKVGKRSLLMFGVVSNIALLGYFKYSDFFIENINLALHSSLSLLHLALPLAISFFTFQQIAYLVDSYRGETKEYDFLNYALFVTFFPQLIAGPIVHHAEMMPQFANKWNLAKNYKNIATGLFIFSIGLFKKVVIADSFAEIADKGFDVLHVLSFTEAWATSLSYTFQLYFDFSGYTDMAIGAALLFNIVLPINFNSPYKALSIQDFWRRWHITLSRFLKDYIYIPLGGNRKGDFRTYVNLMATFTLGGIWHGAGWTFVFWGLLHGIALVVNHIWRSIGFRLPTVLAWFLTFNFINVAWIFFRAKEWDDALKVLSGMTAVETIKIASDMDMHPDWFIMVFVVILTLKTTVEYSKKAIYTPKTAFASGIFFVSAMLLTNHISKFLYFDF
ncbi:MBOAT family protein [Sulfurimonas sp. HSL-1716]|uniref:MBOAT family O-acyltransferase n=1 Tax=Hydrocurvibacter sulfurireducens TaxID=3131937 RepID=UPI0031F9D5C4